MKARQFAASVVACVLPLFFSSVGRAETCPCWTPEELAAIRTDDCGQCGNWIDLGGPPAAEATCVQINGSLREQEASDDPCFYGSPGPLAGWVAVWDQAPGPFGDFPPGCFIWDFDQGINLRIVGGLTPEQAAACVADIVARGTATAALNPGIPHACMGQCFPPDCAMSVLKSRCSNTLTPCGSDADCELFGHCSIDQLPCQSNANCPSVGTCADNSALCYADTDCSKKCSQTGVPCVDETACPGALNVCRQTTCNGISAQSCVGDVGVGTCDDRLAFTSQKFDLVSGLGSELVADGDFTRAQCEGVQTMAYEWPGYFAVVADPTAGPPPGDARYYLSRAVEGVSCLTHGDSSLTPDPRDLLDAACP